MVYFLPGRHLATRAAHISSRGKSHRLKRSPGAMHITLMHPALQAACGACLHNHRLSLRAPLTRPSRPLLCTRALENQGAEIDTGRETESPASEARGSSTLDALSRLLSSSEDGAGSGAAQSSTGSELDRRGDLTGASNSSRAAELQARGRHNFALQCGLVR